MKFCLIKIRKKTYIFVLKTPGPTLLRSAARTAGRRPNAAHLRLRQAAAALVLREPAARPAHLAASGDRVPPESALRQRRRQQRDLPQLVVRRPMGPRAALRHSHRVHAQPALSHDDQRGGGPVFGVGEWQVHHRVCASRGGGQRRYGAGAG